MKSDFLEAPRVFVLVATKTDEQRNQPMLMENTVSISLGIVLMPKKNGDFGVGSLPIVLGLTFGAEAGMQVPRGSTSSAVDQGVSSH